MHKEKAPGNQYSGLISLIIRKRLGKEEISREKLRYCASRSLKKIPTDIELLLHADKKQLPLLRALQTKPTRSLSGVAPLAVMTRPAKCPHGKCIMCPGGIGSGFGNVPQSYTGKEPATRRAIRNAYDPYRQVFNRLEQYVVSGHVPEKIELIVMGGTFMARGRRFRTGFIAGCLKAMNDFAAKFFRKGELRVGLFRSFFELPGDLESRKREASLRTKILRLKGKGMPELEKEKRRNERAAIRCVGLTIETRPDYAGISEANEMLRLGCTRVELGVQTIYNDVLRDIGRGHTVEDSISATRTLKDMGFKINYHMMPGLPGVSAKQDLRALEAIFENGDFRPDMLKIYPCMVIEGTRLHRRWKNGSFTPMSTAMAASLIASFKRKVPDYVRIMRVQRDIPTFATRAGVDRTNLRQYIQAMMKRRGTKCRCIRCREIGRANKQWKKYEIRLLEYFASHGREFFISAEANESLLGFARMRFPSKVLKKEITGATALLRELHVFGESASLSKRGSTQHRGIGKALLGYAESLAGKEGKRKMVVISGIGARGYYRKRGYVLKEPYMVKRI